MQNSVFDIVTFVLRKGGREGKKGRKEKEGGKENEYSLACTYYKVITWEDMKEIGNTSFLGREPGTEDRDTYSTNMYHLLCASPCPSTGQRIRANLHTTLGYNFNSVHMKL